MKKVFFLLAAWLIAMTSFAFDINDTYGIKSQISPEGYQQYVGKIITLRPAYGKLETWNNSGFKPSDELLGQTFVVTKVTVRDVELNKEPNKEIIVNAVQGKKKIKFKGYDKLSVKIGSKGDVKQWPLIGWMPIVFTEPFDEFKSSIVGKTLSHPTVKDQYEVIDAYIGNSDEKDAAAAEIRLKVKNLRTGETKDIAESKKNMAPFADALAGNYKTALVHVEKPEDSSDRYSKTQTITDDGVEKYSYTDSIIDIIIFGTSEQFNFVLNNVSPHSLKIIWNEAAFVGLGSLSSKIMHAGTKFLERESDQPATTLITGAKLYDLAIPTNNVYYDESVIIRPDIEESGWKIRSMLPDEYQGKEAGEIRLMLPIQIKDVVNEYTFVFKVYYTYDRPELLNQEKL